MCFNVKKTSTSTKIDGNEYISHFTGKCKISLVVREKATTINLVNVRIIPSLKVHFLSVAKFEDVDVDVDVDVLVLVQGVFYSEKVWSNNNYGP